MTGAYIRLARSNPSSKYLCFENAPKRSLNEDSKLAMIVDDRKCGEDQKRDDERKYDENGKCDEDGKSY